MTKDELIEKHRDINVDYDWWDCTYEDFVDRLTEVGLRVDPKRIHFTRFWSQGDGAQFSLGRHCLLTLVTDAQTWMLEHWPQYAGKADDGSDAGGPVIAAIKAWCDELLGQCEAYLLLGEQRAWMEAVYLSIDARGHYCHSGYMQLEVEADDSYYEPVALNENDLRDALRGLADALYEGLEQEHDYLTSDERVWESIEANELDDELTQDDEEEEPCNA